MLLQTANLLRRSSDNVSPLRPANLLKPTWIRDRENNKKRSHLTNGFHQDNVSEIISHVL